MADKISIVSHAEGGYATCVSKSKLRTRKYKREHRKRKCLKERFRDQRSKLQEQVQGMQLKVDDWKTKADKLQQ